MGTSGLLSLSNCFLILSQLQIDWPHQEIARRHGARISLYPKLASVFRLLQIPRDHKIVRSGDEIFLWLADSFAQFVRLSSGVHTSAVFPGIYRGATQHRISKGELRVRLGCAPEKGNR